MNKILVCVPTYNRNYIPENMYLQKDTLFYASKLYVSAPTNRNVCLLKAKELKVDYIIMCDDDIKGFFTNWETKLIEPLIEDKNCQMVSASLITSSEGTPAIMIDIQRDMEIRRQLIKEKQLPSACIAFRRNGLMFDQRYTKDNKGAGFEDTDFCFQINKKFPKATYYINNEVKLIHENECKEQKNIKLFHQYFLEKWGKQ